VSVSGADTTRAISSSGVTATVHNWSLMSP
jgi:hypothetical protein